MACLGIVMAQGIATFLGCSSVLMVGASVETGVGGTGQSFLVSNRFSDAKPSLGQGVPCLTGALGISSSGGGLSLMDLVVGCGTSAKCPTASLCIVTSIDSAVDVTIGVCVLTVTTVGTGAVEVGVDGVGWMNTLTLYPLLAIIVFLLLSLTLGAGDFLPLGLVLGWAVFAGFVVHRLVAIGLVAAGSEVGFWTWDQVPLPVRAMFSFPDKGGVRTQFCTPGIAFNYLGCPVPSKHVYSLHCFYFHLCFYCLCRRLTSKTAMQEVALWAQYACHLVN